MSGKTIASIENAIAIIGLAISNDGVTQAEVREELEWSKTNVHYYIKTLRKQGLLTERDGTYYPGLVLTSYGRAAIEYTELSDHLNTVISDLAEETGMMALLAVEQNKKIYYIYQSVPSDSQMERNLIGRARKPHCTAFGKAILAFVDEGHREELLESIELNSYTQNTITSKEELRRELEMVEENEYAYSDGEFEPSVRGFAAPIWDNEGESLLGSLGIIGSDTTLDDPYSNPKAHFHSETDANIVKRFAKMARNKLD